MKSKKRAKIIASCVRDVWESLDSHLDYVSGQVKNDGNRSFHKKCVKHYAKLMRKVVKLYE